MRRRFRRVVGVVAIVLSTSMLTSSTTDIRKHDLLREKLQEVALGPKSAFVSPVEYGVPVFGEENAFSAVPSDLAANADLAHDVQEMTIKRGKTVIAPTT